MQAPGSQWRELVEVLRRHVDRDELVEMARELVRIDTSNPPGNEADAARWVQEQMRALGFEEVRWVEPAPGRASVTGSFGRPGTGKTLLWNGHLDVVPAGDLSAWRYPPFAGVVDGGRLWGRGAADMKGGLAAILEAAAALRRAGLSLAVLVASSNPLDQYIVNHPEYFFNQSPEHGLVNPDNLYILMSHLQCAATARMTASRSAPESELWKRRNSPSSARHRAASGRWARPRKRLSTPPRVRRMVSSSSRCSSVAVSIATSGMRATVGHLLGMLRRRSKAVAAPRGAVDRRRRGLAPLAASNRADAWRRPRSSNGPAGGRRHADRHCRVPSRLSQSSAKALATRLEAELAGTSITSHLLLARSGPPSTEGGSHRRTSRRGARNPLRCPKPRARSGGRVCG